MKIKIAVPSKGRISEPSINILEKAGLGLKDRESRKLISKTFNKDIDVLFARASDIPEFVQDGIADIGITGIDLIKESEADVIELLDLKFGKTKYLEKNNLNLKIVKLSGSTEAAPFIGVADLITDLTSTGTTLKMNHLEIVDTLLKSSIVLIANKKSVETKKDLIDSVSTSIKGVLDAARKKLLMMNVKTKDLECVKEVMPSMGGLTISEVLSEEETVAAQAVIDEDEVFDLVNKLRNAGAKDILVVPIERII